MYASSTIQNFANNLQDFSYVNFIMIGYIFIIISFLINIFVNNISFKDSIVRGCLSLISLDLALIFVIFMHDSFFWILKWQFPVLFLIFVFSFGNKSPFFKVYRGSQERIVAFCMLVYVILSYGFKMKTVNTLIVIIFILCEMMIFGLLKQIYNFIKRNIQEKIEDKKEEKIIQKQEEAREKEREARILEKSLNLDSKEDKSSVDEGNKVDSNEESSVDKTSEDSNENKTADVDKSRNDSNEESSIDKTPEENSNEDVISEDSKENSNEDTTTEDKFSNVEKNSENESEAK